MTEIDEHAMLDLFLDNSDLQPQLGETTRAFRAFGDYCRMGARRSVRKLARAYRPDTDPVQMRSGCDAISAPSLHLTTLFRWSRDNDWQQRARSYDQGLALLIRSLDLEAVKVMRERHIAFAIALQNIVAERLQTLDADELSPETLLRYLEAAIHIEREARGVDAIELAERVNRSSSTAQQTGAMFRYIEVIKDYGPLDSADDDADS